MAAISRLAEAQPGLEALVLYGSRARGDATDSSDWDFAYLASPPFDPADLAGKLSLELATDGVDLVDAARASGLLRFRVARDGRLIYERFPGAFLRLRLDAVQFWCEAAWVIEPALEGVLGRLSDESAR